MSDEPTSGRAEPPNGRSDAGIDARAMLMSNDRARRLRRFWRAIPGAPRCKICTSPFGPPIGPALRLIGKGRWAGNPAYCAGCFKDLYRLRAGAEVECTMFFADVRGSTALAEKVSVADFRALLDRFYATAAEVLVRHEAIVDKFVGDEVVAIFVPALAGRAHSEQAIKAGIALLRATGHEGSPWIPIGVGIHAGIAYVGAVGPAEHVEFTALGDAVNVAARLASAAGSGELLVTEATLAATGFDAGQLERRALRLRGKSVATDTYVMNAGNPAGM